MLLFGCSFSTDEGRVKGYRGNRLLRHGGSGKVNQLLPTAVGDLVMAAPALLPLFVEGLEDIWQGPQWLGLLQDCVLFRTADVLKIQPFVCSMDDGNRVIIDHHRLGVIEGTGWGKLNSMVLSIDLQDASSLGDEQACHRFRLHTFGVLINQVGITFVLAGSCGMFGCLEPSLKASNFAMENIAKGKCCRDIRRKVGNKTRVPKSNGPSWLPPVLEWNPKSRGIQDAFPKVHSMQGDFTGGVTKMHLGPTHVVLQTPELLHPSGMLDVVTMEGRLKVLAPSFLGWGHPSFSDKWGEPLPSSCHGGLPLLSKGLFGLSFFGFPKPMVLYCGGIHGEVNGGVQVWHMHPWHWLWLGPKVPQGILTSKAEAGFKHRVVRKTLMALPWRWQRVRVTTTRHLSGCYVYK